MFLYLVRVWFRVGYGLNITPVDIGILGLGNFAAVVPGSGFQGLKQKENMSEMFAGYAGYWMAGLAVVVILLLLWGLARGRPDGVLDNDLEASEELPELMGKAKLEEGVEIISADEMNFTPKVMQLGDVPDLQQEIREICALLSDRDGNKEEFISLLRLAVEKYPRIPYEMHESLSGFVREVAGFYLSDEELQGLWL